MARLYLVMIALCFIALYPTMGKKLYLVETKDKAGDYIRDYNKDDNTDYIMSGRKKAKRNDYNKDDKTDYIMSGRKKAKGNDYNNDDKTDYIMSGRKKANGNDYNNDDETDYIMSGRKRKITTNSNAMDYGVANPPYRARCKKGWTWSRFLNK